MKRTFIAEFNIFKWGKTKGLEMKFVIGNVNKNKYAVNGLITLNTNIYTHSF